MAMLSPHFLIAAQEGDVVVEDGAAEDGAAEDAAPMEATPEGAEEVLDSEAQAARAAQFASSARELQQKLGELRALLDKKGDAADPALKARLEGLQTQLGNLGLGGEDGPAPGADAELTEFLGGCVAMSARRAGVRRPGTLSMLRRLGEKLTREQAADAELARFIAVCVNEITDDELKAFKAGKLTVLPKAMADKASAQGAREQVLKIEPALWREVQHVSAALAKQLGVVDTKTDGLPLKWGLIAAVPVVCMVCFLVKKFLDMKQREGTKKDKSAKKKHK